MKRIFLYAATLAALCIALFSACENVSPDELGIDMMPTHDAINVTPETFYVHTRTAKAADNMLVANTNECYLGCIIDPVDSTGTTCDYLAQFAVQETFALPPLDKMSKNSEGKVIADSVDVTVYFESYQGDSLSTMKLRVREIDRKPLDESEVYYTTLDPAEFVSAESPSYSSTYSIQDLNASTITSTYYRNVRVPMSAEIGTRLLQAYYENPGAFSNVYNFTHNILKGIYVEHAGGVGVMSKIYTTAMHIYFTYKDAEGKDVPVMKRLAATTEVIQSSRADNSDFTPLMSGANAKCTYLRTPSGLYTEVDIPVAKVVEGEHYTDSINNARLAFRRLNSGSTATYTLAVPQNVLLLPKSLAASFFSESKLPNNVTSYLSTFNASANAYVFSDVSKLVVWMKEQRDKGAGILPEDTEDVRQAKWDAWEAENADWNKAVLIPVSTQTATTTSSLGTTSTTLFGVHNFYGLSSVRLDGGSAYDAENVTPVELNVIYSRYAK